MESRRPQVVASIGTRLALGAYPLLFIVLFGWTYGKHSFDVASAALNWANYLNVLLLSGFALVPPAVARLRALSSHRNDRSVVRDHLALQRGLMLIGALAMLALWAMIESAFPGLASHADGGLASWFPLFAILALSQLPLTLWLGIAQAAGRYRAAFLWVVLPRALSLVVLALGANAGAGPTAMIAVTVAIAMSGQWALGRTARHALHDIDKNILHGPGRAVVVIGRNLSAGAVGLIGTLVTIVPVTIVGRLLPDETGNAQVLVMLSNAVGALIVAAFFPLSLALAGSADDPNRLRAHCLRIARGVASITVLLIGAGWLAFPICMWVAGVCAAELFSVGSLVVFGAGLRLGALGAYHLAVQQGRPHLSLLSATAEGIAVVVLTWWLVEPWKLFALGSAFVAGGALRLVIALRYEVTLLTYRDG